MNEVAILSLLQDNRRRCQIFHFGKENNKKTFLWLCVFVTLKKHIFNAEFLMSCSGMLSFKLEQKLFLKFVYSDTHTDHNLIIMAQHS